jgi:hypothetical protein
MSDHPACGVRPGRRTPQRGQRTPARMRLFDSYVLILHRYFHRGRPACSGGDVPLLRRNNATRLNRNHGRTSAQPAPLVSAPRTKRSSEWRAGIRLPDQPSPPAGPRIIGPVTTKLCTLATLAKPGLFRGLTFEPRDRIPALLTIRRPSPTEMLKFANFSGSSDRTFDRNPSVKAMAILHSFVVTGPYTNDCSRCGPLHFA